MSPVYLSTAANARERQISPLQNNNKSAVTFSNSHSAFPILLCRGRTCAARSLKITAHLRESRWPGMPGPYV